MSGAPKKLYILAILEVLRIFTDSGHRLLQADILRLLKSEYGLNANRKSLRRNLADLQEAGYPVRYRRGWYYEHEFTENELNCLENSIYEWPGEMPVSRLELEGRLAGLGGRCYSPCLNDLARSMRLILEAIERGVKVRFAEIEYDLSGQTHRRCDAEGTVIVHTVSPYRTAVMGGRHVLVGAADGRDSLEHYPLRFMTDITLTETPSRDLSGVIDGAGLSQMSRYIAEHPSSSAGRVVQKVLRVHRSVLCDLMDYFTADTRLSADGAASVRAVVRADETSIRRFILLHPGKAEVVG